MIQLIKNQTKQFTEYCINQQDFIIGLHFLTIPLGLAPVLHVVLSTREIILLRLKGGRARACTTISLLKIIIVVILRVYYVWLSWVVFYVWLSLKGYRAMACSTISLLQTILKF